MAHQIRFAGIGRAIVEKESQSQARLRCRQAPLELASTQKPLSQSAPHHTRGTSAYSPHICICTYALIKRIRLCALCICYIYLYVHTHTLCIYFIQNPSRIPRHLCLIVGETSVRERNISIVEMELAVFFFKRLKKCAIPLLRFPKRI